MLRFGVDRVPDELDDPVQHALRERSEMALTELES
jgi:hypothetical protein